MIKVRLADRSDFSMICDLMEDYFHESTYGRYVPADFDREHATKIMFTAMHAGYIWIALEDDEVVGVLCAVREPNIWFPSAMSLRELFWYVKPEVRKTSAAGKLFVAYRKQAEQLLEDGVIEAYFMTEMATTPSLKLEARGFRLAERLYIKD